MSTTASLKEAAAERFMENRLLKKGVTGDGRTIYEIFGLREV